MRSPPSRLAGTAARYIVTSWSRRVHGHGAERLRHVERMGLARRPHDGDDLKPQRRRAPGCDGGPSKDHPFLTTTRAETKVEASTQRNAMGASQRIAGPCLKSSVAAEQAPDVRRAGAPDTLGASVVRGGGVVRHGHSDYYAIALRRYDGRRVIVRPTGDAALEVFLDARLLCHARPLPPDEPAGPVPATIGPAPPDHDGCLQTDESDGDTCAFTPRIAAVANRRTVLPAPRTAAPSPITRSRRPETPKGRRARPRANRCSGSPVPRSDEQLPGR